MKERGLFEVGDRVRVDGLIHRVTWASYRSWDAACERVFDDYQPCWPSWLKDNEGLDSDETVEDRVRMLQAENDEPTTCLFCLVDDMKRLSDALRTLNAFPIDTETGAR